MTDAADFDFWLGDWSVSDPAAGLVGTNRVSRILGGAVIEESFAMAQQDGSEFTGRSHSVLVPDRGWCQTWVDSQGSYLDFTGGLVDNEMRLERRAPTSDGSTDVIQRMRWYEVTRDSLTWDWLRSTDDGATFDLVWRLAYLRR